jgi:hypothetical protein
VTVSEASNSLSTMIVLSNMYLIMRDVWTGSPRRYQLVKISCEYRGTLWSQVSPRQFELLSPEAYRLRRIWKAVFSNVYISRECSDRITRHTLRTYRPITLNVDVWVTPQVSGAVEFCRLPGAREISSGKS